MAHITPGQCAAQRHRRVRQEAVGIATVPVKKQSTDLPFLIAQRCAGPGPATSRGPPDPSERRTAVLDLVFLVVTGALFGVLALVVRGVERL